MGGSLGSLGQNLLGDLASSVLPGVISGLAGGLGDLGSGLGDLGGGLDPTALDSGLDTTALGNGLSNGLDLTPTGSVIGTAPDGTPIDNAVLAQGDRAGVDRVSDLSSSLEELGGGVPKLVLTPKGATQFIFPNGMILRFDLQPGQYLNGQSPHINIEYNGDNIHIPMI